VSIDSLKLTGEDPLAEQLAIRRTQYEQTMQSAEIDRLHQQNMMRPRLFKLASRLSWVVVLGNFAIVGWYAWHSKGAMDPRVLMFWISSTVVEVLGIVYIIAQYLFPKPRDGRERHGSQRLPDPSNL